MAEICASYGGRENIENRHNQGITIGHIRLPTLHLRCENSSRERNGPTSPKNDLEIRKIDKVSVLREPKEMPPAVDPRRRFPLFTEFPPGALAKKN